MGALTDYLTQDHQQLDAWLAEALPDPAGAGYAAYSRFREGLLRHIAFEEKVLMLDAKERRGGEHLELFPILRLEHSALALLVIPTPTVALLGEIRTLLERHNPREEGPDGLYAVCERLAEAEAERLLERARSMPPVPVAKHYDGPRAHRTLESALAFAALGRSKQQR